MIKVFNFENTNDFAANLYVVGEKNGPCVLIDCGRIDSSVEEYISKNHSFVAGILLTHGHFDHFKDLNKIVQKYNCTVFISEKDNELLSDSSLNCSKYGYNHEVSVQLSNVYFVDDMDEITFPNNYKFVVIETPYHTDGSVCYLLEKENALFTGDSLFKESIGRSDLPTSNRKLQKESLNKIASLDEKLNIYPGHGELTNLLHEINYNYFLK